MPGTHFCKLRCWYLQYTTGHVGKVFLDGSPITSLLNIYTVYLVYIVFFCFLHFKAIFLLHSRIYQSKRPFLTEAQIGLSYTVEKVLPLFFEPIASLISPQNAHPHAHTPIPDTTQQYHTSAPTLP